MTAGLKTTRTQAERRETSIRQILEAAVDLIAQNGVKDLTMGEVGVHAGYSRGLPHQYFGTKEKLFEEVLQFIVERFSERRKRQPHAADGLASIKSLVAAYLERDENEWKASRAFIMLIADASLMGRSGREFINALQRKNIDFIVRHLRVARGRRAAKSPLTDEALAIILMSAMRGLALQALTDKDLDLRAVQRAIDALFDRLFD